MGEYKNYPRPALSTRPTILYSTNARIPYLVSLLPNIAPLPSPNYLLAFIHPSVGIPFYAPCDDARPSYHYSQNSSSSLPSQALHCVTSTRSLRSARMELCICKPRTHARIASSISCTVTSRRGALCYEVPRNQLLFASLFRLLALFRSRPRFIFSASLFSVRARALCPLRLARVAIHL